MTKDKLIEVINKLPNKFSIDDLLEEILLIQKIENGLEQSEGGNVIPDEKLDQELPEWLR